MSASTLAVSAAGFCCAEELHAPAMRTAVAIATVRMMPSPSALETGGGNFATLGVLGEIRDQRHADIRSHFQLRHPHLPIAVVQAVLHGHHLRGRDAVGRPLADNLFRLLR